MGVFESFPYTNQQNLNLDWVLALLRELEKAIDNGFDEVVRTWIEEHYNELFFNASYDPETETVIFAKREV